MLKFFEKLIKKRTEKIVNIFNSFIDKKGKVLDIGAGGGWIAKEIKKRKEVDITLLDVININQTDLKLTLYDGDKIPFSSNSFDSSLLIFTLHHCFSPLKVLKEAKRITRGKIIIIEDIPHSFLNRIFLYLWDIIANLLSLVKPPGENMYFNFKRVSEWKDIFEILELKQVFQKTFSSKNIHHALFVLQK